MAVAALAVAPMMGWSTRHARALARIVSRHTVTYSEMVTDSAVLRLHARGDEWSLRNLVAPDTHEAPSVLQLGGCNPETMRRAARVLAERGASYSAVNLNCGCPSPAVATDGSFGAALMFEPPRIAALCTAIAEASAR
jgi:tRNA-dihydrouridine synthase A